jgi:hypothetical protein
VTESLLSQQLESPSGTGRVEPRCEISLSATDTNQRDANPPTHSHWQIWRCAQVPNLVHGARLSRVLTP